MIPITQVQRRIRNLNESGISNINTAAYTEGLKNNYNYDSCCKLIENYKVLDAEPIVALEIALNYFDMILENDSNPIHIGNARDLIIEDVKKTRDANGIIKLMSRRKANITSKIMSKINKTISNVKAAVGMGATTNNGSSNPDSKHKAMVQASKKEDQAKVNAATECYNAFIDEAVECRALDTIWLCHSKIGKRFNLGKVFESCNGDVEKCVYEFCTLLDTFDVPYRAKFNICLENIQYELSKHDRVNRKQLANLITEYFLVNGGYYTNTMIYEDTSNKEMTYKLFKYGQRLVKHNDPKVHEIGDMLVKALVNMKNIGKSSVDTLGKILGKTILLLGVANFVLAISVGVVALLCLVAIGLIVLLATVIVPTLELAAAAVIWKFLDPDADKKIKEVSEKTKGKRKRELNKLLTVLAKYKSSEPTTEDVELETRKAFLDEEFACNKYDMFHILETNKFYSEEDTKEAMQMLNEKSFGVIKNMTLEEMVVGLHEDRGLNISTKASEVLKKIKNTANKTPENLKSMIKTLFTDKPDHITQELPNLFSILFKLIVIGGAFAISVGLGIIVGIAYYITSMNVSRKEADKYIDQYKKEKEKAKKKMDKMTDEKQKERCQKYIDQLDKDIDKLESWKDSLYSDSEKEERDKENDSSDDFNIDDELKLEEALVDLTTYDAAASIVQGFNNGEKLVAHLKDINLNKDIVESVCSIAIMYENLLDKRQLRSVLEDIEMENKLKGSYEPDMYRKWEAARYGIELLDADRIYPSKSLCHAACACMAMDKVCEAIEYNQTQPIQEMNVINTLNMLIDAGKRKFNELDDKQKILSKQLDSSLENLRSAMENSLKQTNREAVIRGQILPPASKIIKMALISGATFLISPALTVIYLLGVFALSKNIRTKERQLILDELDTELKVCDEYIQRAKDNQDMKAYRECLQIQKKLLRQRDRLSYKIKFEYNEKTPESVDQYHKDRGDVT